jgi:imidazolonepropionase-like amidohydrolase
MRKDLTVFLVGCAFLLIGGVWLLKGGAEETFLIKGAKIYTCSAKGVLNDVALVVEGGKIREIIQRKALPSLPIKDYSGNCIMPGMVDAHTYLSGFYRLLENTEAMTSDLLAYVAFDSFSPEIKNALHSGITTVNFAPRNENLVGGMSSVFKLFPEHELSSLLKEKAFLKISFNTEAQSPDRAPTSLMGAEKIVSDRMMTFKANQESRREMVFEQQGIQALLNGNLEPMIAASSFAEINTALDWLEEWNLEGTIVGGEEAHLLIDSLKERKVPVLFSSILPSYPEKFSRNAALLVERGIKTAFVSHMPEGEPWGLRFSALLLVHQGVSQEEALKTITINPAQILGVDRAVGSLKEGKDADMVILSGEPLDLSSRVIAVYVNGQPVFEEKK